MISQNLSLSSLGESIRETFKSSTATLRQQLLAQQHEETNDQNNKPNGRGGGISPSRSEQHPNRMHHVLLPSDHQQQISSPPPKTDHSNEVTTLSVDPKALSSTSPNSFLKNCSQAKLENSDRNTTTGSPYRFEDEDVFEDESSGYQRQIENKLSKSKPPGPMNTDDWRQRGKEMVEYIAEYIDTIGKRRVTPNIEPGYLKNRIPDSAPFKPESWQQIMEDFESHIMPGVTHWQHPRFHAYFPSGNSFPSILADMLTDAIGCNGFSWVRLNCDFLNRTKYLIVCLLPEIFFIFVTQAASPACTELEVIMLDWVGKMMGLPPDFACFGEGSRGGGVIQGSASDAVLVCLLAARYSAIKALKKKFPLEEDGVLLSKLMAYCSKEVST
jgi:hypothetical protein